MGETSIIGASIISCGKCEARNYLDPYSYWNFTGDVKCAGCDQVWYLEKENGQVTAGPEAGKGGEVHLPGYAETSDLKPLSGEGKTSPPPWANVEYVGKPKGLTKSNRGGLMAGRALEPDELEGHVWKEVIASRKYGKTWF
jgi:hypothetical protein